MKKDGNTIQKKEIIICEALHRGLAGISPHTASGADEIPQTVTECVSKASIVVPGTPTHASMQPILY